MHAEFILAAGLVGFAAAQRSSTCTVTATTTIENQQDATGLAGCQTVAGSIEIAAANAISIPGVQVITGDLISSDSGALTSLSANDLEEIGGDFKLTNLTALSNLIFPELTKVRSLSFEALPFLSELTFTNEVSEAETVLVTNTFLSSLKGINLNSVRDLNINNNRRLQNVSTTLENIEGSLIFESNGDRLAVDFPNLEYAANLTFRGIASINIPSLKAVNGSMGFYENDNLTSIMAPNLTTVGINSGSDADGGVAFVANPVLTNLSFPEFTKSGGQVQVANNTQLDEIAFPKLEFVSGAIDFSGNFTTPQLPAISDVKGAFNVQSQQEIDCDSFSSQRGGAIQGKFTCVSAEEDVQSLDGDKTSGGSKGGSKKKESAATQTSISAAIFGLVAVASLAMLF